MRLPVGARIALAIMIGLALQPTAALRDVPSWLAQAASAIPQGNAASAVMWLRRAALRLPWDSALQQQTALAELAAGNYAEAARRLQTLGQVAGFSPTVRVALGDALAAQGQMTLALAEWEQARLSLPNDAELTYRLAQGYEAQDQLAQAIDLYATLPPEHPGFIRAALLTAVTTPLQSVARLMLAAQAAPPPTNLVARALLETVKQAAPSGDEAFALTSVGYTLIQNNENALAERALARAAILNPKYADAFTFLGLARDRNGGNGQQAYETAAALAPDNYLPRFLLGLHWRRLGQSGQALPWLQAAQRLDPTNPAIAAEIGGALAAQGDVLAAEIALTQATQLGGADPAFWILLAQFYVDNNFKVNSPGLEIARTATILAEQRGTRAQQALARDALGLAYLLTNDLPNSQESLAQAQALDPTLPRAHYHQGLLAAQQGDVRAARAAFETALGLDPQGEVGNRALRALAQLPAP